jgi:hypothetical protein
MKENRFSKAEKILPVKCIFTWRWGWKLKWAKLTASDTERDNERARLSIEEISHSINVKRWQVRPSIEKMHAVSA